MTIQEQIKELNKVITILIKSMPKRLEGGKYTSVELDYQIRCCQAAVKSLETLDKMKQEVKQCLETLKEFNFELIQ